MEFQFWRKLGTRLRKHQQQRRKLRETFRRRRNREVKAINVRTISICDVVDKEARVVLVVEFIKSKNKHILGIADTRRKGQSSKGINGNNVIMLRAVDLKNSAVYGNNVLMWRELTLKIERFKSFALYPL